MREIKFRAWDRGVGMIDDWAVVKPISSTMPDLTVSTKHRSPPYYIEAVMQYTGLKDKNGKEIYEGDIVRFITDREETLEVYWYEETCGWQMKRIFDTGTMFIPNYTAYLEVIGNIYENPKLLEAKVSG